MNDTVSDPHGIQRGLDAIKRASTTVDPTGSVDVAFSIPEGRAKWIAASTSREPLTPEQRLAAVESTLAKLVLLLERHGVRFVDGPSFGPGYAVVP